MTSIKTPGVYVQEISKLPPSVAQVATAIPAFIGFTQKSVGADGEDLDMVPTRIGSLLEYETYFGGGPSETMNLKVSYDSGTKAWSADFDPDAAAFAASKFTMYYHMQMFFANGGGPCYIVSCGDYKTNLSVASTIKDSLKDGLDKVALEDEVTLIAFPDAVGTISDESTYYSLQQDALAQCRKLQDRFAVMDIYDDTVDGVDDFRSGIGNNNLNYGAAYFPFLKTTLAYTYDDADISLAWDVAFDNTGDPLDDITNEDTLFKISKSSNDYQQEFDGAYNAVKTFIGKQSVTLNPSSSILGIYAFVDSTRGVWKAPANVSLNSVVAPTVKVDNDIQDDLNVHTTGKSVNAIRAFTGKGVLVWGARTLAGNDNEWRYVSVRRLFIMVEESIQESTDWAVFEPNDANTWVKVKGMIDNYLTNLWKQGALAGSKPEQAFFVNVGLGTTMTAQDILNGFMNVEIGLAAVRPAEFIVLKFSHKLQES